MKFRQGQPVLLLTIDGKPANGTAVVEAVNEENQTYTVKHTLNDTAEPDVIDNIPEGRLRPLYVT